MGMVMVVWQINFKYLFVMMKEKGVGMAHYFLMKRF